MCRISMVYNGPVIKGGCVTQRSIRARFNYFCQKTVTPRPRSKTWSSWKQPAPIVHVIWRVSFKTVMMYKNSVVKS
jgi:hypothetical protein